MKAMILRHIRRIEGASAPLEPADLPEPEPSADQILIEVSTCGVCHTELDEIEGRTPPPHLPVVPGHQVVGRVAAAGAEARRFKLGERVGVAWIYSACGVCGLCRAGQREPMPPISAPPGAMPTVAMPSA